MRVCGVDIRKRRSLYLGAGYTKAGTALKHRGPVSASAKCITRPGTDRASRRCRGVHCPASRAGCAAVRAHASNRTAAGNSVARSAPRSASACGFSWALMWRSNAAASSSGMVTVTLFTHPAFRQPAGAGERGAKSPILKWCWRGESNPQEDKPRQILSLLRLPVPPLQHDRVSDYCTATCAAPAAAPAKPSQVPVAV